MNLILCGSHTQIKGESVCVEDSGAGRCHYHKWRDVPVRLGGINSLILISTAEGATPLREITNLYAGHLWTRQEPEQKMIPYSQEPGPDNLL